MATTLTSCGTLRRAGKDVMLGLGTPVLMAYGGATDGATSAQHVREGLGSGGAVEVLAFPFTFTYHAIEHMCGGIVHILDLPCCLFYWMAEIHPAGPEVEPLQIYTGTWFDKPAKKKGTDAESGEVVPAGN